MLRHPHVRYVIYRLVVPNNWPLPPHRRITIEAHHIVTEIVIIVVAVVRQCAMDARWEDVRYPSVAGQPKYASVIHATKSINVIREEELDRIRMLRLATETGFY